MLKGEMGIRWKIYARGRRNIMRNKLMSQPNLSDEYIFVCRNFKSFKCLKKIFDVN